MKDRLANIAHHEAAHAVAAYHLHIKIKHVSIVTTADWLGIVRTSAARLASRLGEFDDSVRGIDRAERHIVVFYAGAIASRKYSPGSHWRATGSSDFDVAAMLFGHICGADAKYQLLYSKLLWRRAELVVDLHWREVQYLAAALLKHKSLDADQVRDEIGLSHGLKPFRLSSTSQK